MYSSLTDEVYIAADGNYRKGRVSKDGTVEYTVSKITPHQMAGKLTGMQCAKNIFGKEGRYASANYCIGYEGDIVCNVEEEDRAFTSSSEWNDCQAITIEVSNSENGTDEITEESWNSLVNLCVDICKRYNFRLEFDGTPEGSLTMHKMYANTNCPGAYLESRMEELAMTVNSILEESDLQYQAHVEGIGWQDIKNAGEIAGTTGECRRMEAIRIFGKNGIDLQYRAHVEGIGWQDWVGNGEIAGTTGEYKRMEALQIKCNRNLESKEHIEKVGWMPSSTGQELYLGTEGKCLRMEAIEISLI